MGAKQRRGAWWQPTCRCRDPIILLHSCPHSSRPLRASQDKLTWQRSSVGSQAPSRLSPGGERQGLTALPGRPPGQFRLTASSPARDVPTSRLLIDTLRAPGRDREYIASRADHRLMPGRSSDGGERLTNGHHRATSTNGEQLEAGHESKCAAGRMRSVLDYGERTRLWACASLTCRLELQSCPNATTRATAGLQLHSAEKLCAVRTP